MISTNNPINRRKSLSINHNKPLHLRTMRRHSIVGGDRLSPIHKARLAPRKSILKASLNVPSADDSPDSDSGDTQMDNTRRQSIARRVSFASCKNVLEFAGPGSRRKSRGKTKPVSDATTSVGEEHDEGTGKLPVNDENAYPGAGSYRRRRSSIRQSIGTEAGELSMDMDMDDTAVGPAAFLQIQKASRGTTSGDDEEGDADDDDDMDLTEALGESIFRRRSIRRASASRPPLSSIPIAPSSQASRASDHYDMNRSQDSFTDDTQSSTDASFMEQRVEYTVPLSKPLKKRGPPDDAWLALRAMTHSGDTPLGPSVSSDDENSYRAGDDMELDDAVRRLEDARSSFPIAGEEDLQVEEIMEDSFSSMDNSLEDRVGHGEETINITQMLQNGTFGTLSAATSSMETTSVYGAILAGEFPEPDDPVTIVREEQMPSPPEENFQPPTVFHPPPPDTTIGAKFPAARKLSKPTIPQPFSFSFTPKSTSTVPSTPSFPSSSRAKVPSKPNTSPKKPSQIPTAAFAPPVARPSPKRPASQTTTETDENRPSPAKRMAMANKWVDLAVPGKPTAESIDTSVPKPLSPSKKAPFQTSSAPAQPATQTSHSLRRPSGYFARRRSMLADSSVTENHAVFEVANTRHGRISMGAQGLPNPQDGVRKTQALPRDPGRQLGVSSKEGRQLPATKPIDTVAPVSTPDPDVLAQSLVGSSLEAEPSEHLDNNDVGIQMAATEQWRDGVIGQEFAQDDEDPPISIEQFFDMTGIRFMDEITAPRRSTHPSQLRRPPQSRRLSSGDVPLAEYVVASGVDLPRLKLFTRVSQDLQNWVDESKAVYKQAEDEAAKLTPELFREYSQADEEGRDQLLHQLQLMKVNARGKAKSEWYDWKLKWIQGLNQAAEENFAKLESDARVLEEINNCAQQIIPALEEEYAEVMRELEQEQAAVAEIENSNLDYLNELKASITEQEVEVESLRSEVAERTSQLQWLQEKIGETEFQQKEAAQAIAQANKTLQIQKNSTSAEVFRLKDQLEFLEEIHMVKVTKTNADMFEFVYASQFRVSIPCIGFKPILKDTQIHDVAEAKTQGKDAHPELSAFWLRVARDQIVNGPERTKSQVVQHLSDYWDSCTHIRSQLKLIAIKYPLSIEVLPRKLDVPPRFKATASVLYHTTTSKASISFVFDQDTFSRWPASIRSLKCDVNVIYGSIERDRIYDAVTGRLAEAGPGDNHGCLYDACIVAMDTCQ